MRHAIRLSFFLLMFFLFPVVIFAAANSDRLMDDFSFQMDRYREEYSEFKTKEGQYLKLKSFASQEEMVAAARTMLIRRGMAWRTYWIANKGLFAETEGFDPTKKTELLQKMDEEVVWIEQHIKKLESLTTKEDLLAEATVLNERKNELATLGIKAQLTLKLARLNNAANELLRLNDTLRKEAAIQIKNPEILDSRNRGFNAVETQLKQVGVSVAETAKKVETISSAFGSENAYDRIMLNLMPLWETTNHSRELLVELSEGIDL